MLLSSMHTACPVQDAAPKPGHCCIYNYHLKCCGRKTYKRRLSVAGNARRRQCCQRSWILRCHCRWEAGNAERSVQPRHVCQCHLAVHMESCSQTAVAQAGLSRSKLHEGVCKSDPGCGCEVDAESVRLQQVQQHCSARIGVADVTADVSRQAIKGTIGRLAPAHLSCSIVGSASRSLHAPACPNPVPCASIMHVARAVQSRQEWQISSSGICLNILS